MLMTRLSLGARARGIVLAVAALVVSLVVVGGYGAAQAGQVPPSDKKQTTRNKSRGAEHEPPFVPPGG